MSTQPLPPTESTLDADGRVAVDAPCVQCGYNLRTLKADAVCPECAQPVSFSIQGFFLRFAPPQWVRGLARGLVLVLVALGGAVIILPLISLIVAIPIMVSASKTPGLPPNLPGHSAAIAQFIGHSLLVALAIIGLLYLTRPDPGQPSRAEGFTARRVVRLCCALLPAPTVVNLIAALCVAMPTGWSPASTTMPATLAPMFSTFIGVGLASGLLALIVYAITPLALLRHLSGLLRRIPRPGLVRFARVEFWGLLVAASLGTLSFTLMAFTMMPALGPLMAAATSMPSSMPTTLPGSSVRVVAGPWGNVNVMQVQATTTGPATTSASAVEVTAPLAALGYVVPTTGPATSAPTTLPAVPGFMPPPGFLPTMMLTGCAGATGGCGGALFCVAGIVLLIMSAAALFKVAREAEVNVLLKSSGTRL